MFVLRQKASPRWLQHVEAVLPSLDLCMLQHTTFGTRRSFATQRDAESQICTPQQAHKPLREPPPYLSMGYGNKAFKLYFDKLRRNFERYWRPRDPKQVPFDTVFSREFERLRRHNTGLPVLTGQTIVCKVMAVGMCIVHRHNNTYTHTLQTSTATCCGLTLASRHMPSFTCASSSLKTSWPPRTDPSSLTRLPSSSGKWGIRCTLSSR